MCKVYGIDAGLSDAQPGDIVELSPTAHEVAARVGNIGGLLTALRNNSTVHKNGMTTTKLQSGDTELIYYYLRMYKELLETSPVSA